MNYIFMSFKKAQRVETKNTQINERSHCQLRAKLQISETLKSIGRTKLILEGGQKVE